MIRCPCHIQLWSGHRCRETRHLPYLPFSISTPGHHPAVIILTSRCASQKARCARLFPTTERKTRYPNLTKNSIPKPRNIRYQRRHKSSNQSKLKKGASFHRLLECISFVKEPSPSSHRSDRTPPQRKIHDPHRGVPASAAPSAVAATRSRTPVSARRRFVGRRRHRAHRQSVAERGGPSTRCAE